MLKIFHLGIFGLIDVVVCLTVLLYEVHSLVSGGYYLVAVIAVFGVERYTDTCLYVYRNVSKLGVVALVKLIYKVKRQALYLLDLLGIGDTKNKLVTAETSCESASLYTLFDTAGNILDNLAPTECPKRSFMNLKSSTSIKSTATFECALRSISLLSSRSNVLLL